MNSLNKRIDWVALGAIALYTVAAVLLISWDGYLYDEWPHYDVNWFYTCGKAWMNGMTPYVDFADSKGPLLWLIYGVGYLLSPHNYLGLFWLSCALYIWIFYWCYKSARLFTLNRWLALLVVAIVSVFMLSGLAHEEFKAEDWCNGLLAPVIYRFLLYAVADRTDKRFVMRSALLLGFVLGASFLIKYSCTLMFMAFVPYFGVAMPRNEGHSVARAWAWGLAGAILALAPMAAVLLAQGCLSDFLNEYILVTFATFGNMAGDSLTATKAWDILTDWHMLVYLAGLAVSIFLYCWRVRRGAWLVAIAALWFLAVTLLNAAGRPYFNTLSTFAWYGVPVAVLLLAQWLDRKWLGIWVAVASLAALFMTVRHNSFFRVPSLECEVSHYYGGLMAQYDHPRLLYLMSHDRGFGVYSQALPACKYWSLQVGYTPEMAADQINAVKERKADVIFVNSSDNAMIELVEKMGYHRYDFTDVGVGEKEWQRNLLYSRKPLTRTDQWPKVTPKDVLLKRIASSYQTFAPNDSLP